MDTYVPRELPVFNWGDFQQSPPSLPDSMTSDITSLLSVRSYLPPEAYTSQNAPSSTPSPSPGILALELASSWNQTNISQTPLSKPMPQRPQKRQRCGSKKTSSAKGPGAPREVGESNENPAERRRMRSRVAQRAYRERQQATLNGLKNRVSLLETSIEKMSSAMLVFSEELVQSGILRSHSALTGKLRDTMKVFFTMAAGLSLDDDDELRVLVDSNDTTNSSPRPRQQPPINRLSLNLPSHYRLDGTDLYQPNSAVLPHPVNSPEVSIIDVSAFIQRLLLEALYQGHLALGDPSISLSQLQRPFGLIFSMMNRERLTSYLKAELYSQIHQKPLTGWDEVPFFRLGGAGTHYPHWSSTGRRSTFVAPRQSGGTVEDPLTLVTAELRTQLQGDWFDLRDLEWFLRDKNVLLIASPGEPTISSKVQTRINVSRFMSALISRGVCLGRTPGFQRNDVEEALQLSKVA
ncbi:hypothetical protein ASPCAL05076 [Aspergillus calidoustus]|uniref:BZIP domain-containing protein n=1 Tax=Aspergillus calidoustus TaxID=454130 RepID=A0A0U5GSW1_ASPCI|nr:hypothetical protein ASPCAL05076 [Aspergillus calidoustus]